MKDRLSGKQVNAWYLVATIPPILSVAGYSNWVGILPMGILCAALCSIVSGREQPRWVCVLELLWLTVYLGVVGSWSTACWETDHPAIPAILIFLAAFASSNGSVRVSRLAAVLIWLVLPVLVLVSLASIADIRWDWISSGSALPGGILTSLLLLPCLRGYLPKPEREGRWLPWLLPVIAVAASILLAGNGSESFYECSKGITLFGVAERFEALVACVLTMGWFALFCVIFSAIFHLTEKIFLPAAKYSVWICSGISVILLGILPQEGDWLVVGTLIFWGFLPILTQGLVGEKKVEKK